MKLDDKYPDAQPGIPASPNIVKLLAENQERIAAFVASPRGGSIGS